MNDKNHEKPSEPHAKHIIRQEEIEKFSAPTGHHTDIIADPTLNPIMERAQSSGKSPDASSGSGGNFPSASENNKSGKS